MSLHIWPDFHLKALTPEDLAQMESRLRRVGQALPHLDLAEHYIAVAREEVIPLVCSPAGQALGQALLDTSAGRGLGILLGALQETNREVGLVPSAWDLSLDTPTWDLLLDNCHWDPSLCAAPEYPDLPQKGDDPRAYHHQYQPPKAESRHGYGKKPPKALQKERARQKAAKAARKRNR